MTTISGAVRYFLVRRKRGFMRRQQCHQHDSAARLPIRPQSCVPMKSEFRTPSSADCCLLERPTHSSQLSKRVWIEAWNLCLLKPRRPCYCPTSWLTTKSWSHTSLHAWGPDAVITMRIHDWWLFAKQLRDHGRVAC